MHSKFKTILNVVQVKVATVSRSSRAILLSFWYFFYLCQLQHRKISGGLHKKQLHLLHVSDQPIKLGDLGFWLADILRKKITGITECIKVHDIISTIK